MSEIIEHLRGEYRISTDKRKLDIDVIHKYLCQRSYWALGRQRRVVEKSVRNSLCYGVFHGSSQIGFARVVTDFSTFAWLCDVFILEEFRGQGLGKWLVECAVSHPELGNLKNFLLATTDAHDLYRQHGGFSNLPSPDKWMARRRSDSN
jgi:GNAT superfamily N-acetyltransferase